MLDGHAADWLIVSARTAGAPTDVDGITLFFVRPDAPGVTIEQHTRVDGRKAAVVRLDGVEVGRDAVLGPVSGGVALLGGALVRATIGLTASPISW